MSALFVFDVDGTLLRSATPVEGKPLYEALNGEEWPHETWWDRPETLALPAPAIPETLDAFCSAAADPTATVVVMTGRPEVPGMREAVASALAAAGVEIPDDRLYLKPAGGPAVDWPATLAYKREAIAALVTELSPTALWIWEDRPGQVNGFRETEFGLPTIVTRVPSPEFS